MLGSRDALINMTMDLCPPLRIDVHVEYCYSGVRPWFVNSFSGATDCGPRLAKSTEIVRT